MSRIVIWSECQFAKFALQKIISQRLPYINDIVHFSKNEGVKLSSNDYLIIDPSGCGFHKCYNFLKEYEDVLDPERILIFSSMVDMLMLQLFFKKTFKFLDNKKNITEIINVIEQFVQLENITTHSKPYNITKMEGKILVMMMSGLSVMNISNILKLSVKTVSVHKCNSLRKIGIDASRSSTLFFLQGHNVFSKDEIQY